MQNSPEFDGHEVSTADNKVCLSLIKCCDIILERSTESIGFCPACH